MTCSTKLRKNTRSHDLTHLLRSRKPPLVDLIRRGLTSAERRLGCLVWRFIHDSCYWQAHTRDQMSPSHRLPNTDPIDVKPQEIKTSKTQTQLMAPGLLILGGASARAAPPLWHRLGQGRSALVRPHQIGSTSGGLRDLRRCVRSWESVFFLNFVEQDT